LANVTLYATPVYSMLANVLIAGPIMLLMWFDGQPASTVIGVGLILNSFARFVEEAYRGEPQTPVFAGLRLYQWVALASIGVGMLLSLVPSPSLAVDGILNTQGVGISLAVGLIAGLAMGVDMPEGTARFSRLTP
jgi:hypothetical protein